MASTEPCKASFGRVFDDPLGPCHMCAFRAAGARPPPPLSAVLRTSSNASLFPAPQIQSAPGSLNAVPESFFTFSFRMMALTLKSLPALPSPLTGRATKAGPCTYRLFAESCSTVTLFTCCCQTHLPQINCPEISTSSVLSTVKKN